jgi:hypothetical protein
MYFKRPSFRRGGSTGIGQLSSNRQMYAGGGNIGGGIISGSNLGSRTGFSVLDIIGGGMQEELTGGSNQRSRPRIGTKVVSRQNIPTGGLRKGNIGSRLLSQLRGLSVPSASTTGLMSLPFVGPAAIAYANRPKTLAEKKVMQDYGMLDETFGVAEDYEKYDADRKKARGIGEEISFTDALLMDPETGKYPRILGRTEDRDPVTKRDDDFEMPRGGGSDFAEIAETVIADKKEDTPIKTDDDTPKEPSFEDTYEAEKKKLEKLLGDDDDRGMAAIALSEAIGTPGTIADKAAVLNKSLLGIMQGKKKDRKDIAKLAYTATKEIEKAKIAAGKEGFSERQLKDLKRLQRIVNDKTGSYSDAEKKAAQAEINITKQAIDVIGSKKGTEGLTTGDIKVLGNIDALVKEIKRHEGKNDEKYKAALAKFARAKAALQGFAQFNGALAIAEAEIGGTLFKKDGGRIKKQLGGGTETTAMEVSETVGQGETPTAQVQQLSFSELRNRLPKEITDDVIRLLSNSNEALQDFAYIRTQGDVSKFNTKYGVTLVLPAQTA